MHFSRQGHRDTHKTFAIVKASETPPIFLQNRKCPIRNLPNSTVGMLSAKELFIFLSKNDLLIHFTYAYVYMPEFVCSTCM